MNRISKFTIHYFLFIISTIIILIIIIGLNHQYHCKNIHDLSIMKHVA